MRFLRADGLPRKLRTAPRDAANCASTAPSGAEACCIVVALLWRPKCSFNVVVAGGCLVAGERARLIVMVDVPRRIRRVAALEVEFATSLAAIVFAAPTSGVPIAGLQPVFARKWRLPAPAGGVLEAKTHEFPFTFDVPRDLPPTSRGIHHAMDLELSVHWAMSSRLRLHPVVALPPQVGTRTPKAVRSAPNFYDDVLVELAFTSTTVVVGEKLLGSVALRGGFDATFTALVLEMNELISSEQLLPHSVPIATLSIDRERLRDGSSVPFEFPTEGYSPSFASPRLQRRHVLGVRAAARRSGQFGVDIRVLPRDSIVVDVETAAAPIGRDWLDRFAAALASETGLRRGSPPHLLSGREGAVELQIIDAPHNSHLGLLVVYGFPDLQLGIRWTPRSVLSRPHGRVALPKVLDGRFALRLEPETLASGHDASLQSFFDVLLSGLDGADEVGLSDRSLHVHFAFDDANPDLGTAVRAARAKAVAIDAAIKALPFGGPASAREAWAALAASEEAALIPSGPAVTGLMLSARINGEAREVVATIRTRGPKPLTEAELDFSRWPLPEAARIGVSGAALGGNATGLDAARPGFDEVRIHDDGGKATLIRVGFTDDPRDLLPYLEAFVQWIFDARGERRVQAPYR